MRVLIVTDYFYPHWTGISKSIFNFTQALQDEFDITVLTVKHDGKLPNWEKIGKTTIIRSPPLFSFSRAKISLILFWKFIKMIQGYDVVFINSPCVHILPIAVFTKIFQKKLLIFHQGDLILPKGIINRFVEKIFDTSTFISFFLADKVSTYTRDYAEHSRVLKPFIQKFTPLIMPIIISSHSGERSQVPDGTWRSDSRIDSGRTRSSFARMTRLKSQKKILFGFGGRFVEEKGFDILLTAIPKIVSKLPKAHFVFAGEIKMEYEKTYENLKTQILRVKKYITILGLLNNEELTFFYKNIDFIVIPSLSDCFPLFQAEAMLLGVPSIVADIPGARYLVGKTGFGAIFKKEDSKDLANKIIDIVSKKETIKKNYYKLLQVLDLTKNVEAVRKYIAE